MQEKTTKIINSSRYKRPIKLGQYIKKVIRIKKIKNIFNDFIK